MKKGTVLGRWTLTEYVDSGGNGDVWFVESGDERVALKVLHRGGRNDYARFRREVGICSNLGSGAGVLPIIDSHLPERPTEEDRAWYVMPRAIPLGDALYGQPLDRKVEAIARVVEILAVLLEIVRLHHRDLKLENLFELEEEEVAVGDFGLAKSPGDPDLTEPGKIAGPLHQLAPELLAGDSDPDLEKIDVYYAAITLWRLVTEKPNTPRGNIRAHEADSVALLLPDELRIGELANIIDRATSRSPAARPTLRQLEAELRAWLNSRRFETQHLEQARRFEFTARHEQTELRNRVVLEWLINEVRTQPVFNTLMYDVADPDKPSDEITGLTEGEIGRALNDLIELGFIAGEPHHVMGRREPRSFSQLYPRPVGLREVLDVEAFVEESAPFLEAFVDPVDVLTLPRDIAPREIVAGLVITPAEAYFKMILLRFFGHLEYRQLDETGGGASFMSVHATAPGKRWLYQLTRSSAPAKGDARTDVRILEIRWQSGAERTITFAADVQWRGQGPTRAAYRARVGEREVTCTPPMQDMVANHMPWQVYVEVPRSDVGDLIQALGNEPTLYGRTLTLDVSVDGDVVATHTWREHEYTVEENSERREIQQRVWRIGRGEGTPADDEADLRAEARARRFGGTGA